MDWLNLGRKLLPIPAQRVFKNLIRLIDFTLWNAAQDHFSCYLFRNAVLKLGCTLDALGML